MDYWRKKERNSHLPQMMLMLLSMVTAADRCGYTDVSLPRASFRCQDRKKVGCVFSGRCTPAKDIRRESMLVFTRLLGRIFFFATAGSRLCSPWHRIVLCAFEPCMVWRRHMVTQTHKRCDPSMMFHHVTLVRSSAASLLVVHFTDV